MIVGFIIFNPDDHLNRTNLDLFKRSALLVDCYMYLYLFFKVFFILLSEKEKAATRQWKSCQKIQGIQILIEYMTHFHCQPVSEIQRICHTTLSLTFSHISQNSSSKKKKNHILLYSTCVSYVCNTKMPGLKHINWFIGDFYFEMWKKHA